jgi:5S rRNA maturation endonuclease (ribonuclease M5)
LNAVKSKNSGLNIDEVEIKDIKDKSATVATKSSSTVYTGSVNVTFTTTPDVTTKPLTDDLTEADLGDIKDNKETTILDAVKAKNTAVDETQLEVANITDKGATINVIKDSKVYDAGDTVNVTYTVTPTTKDLSEDITTKTLVNPLDNFEDTTILAAVKAENPELVEDEVEVVEGATDTTATIKVKDGSEVYIAGGTVDVTYTVTPTTKALSEDITTKTLVNPLDNFEDTTILAAVKAENPELVEDEVEVVEGATDTTATIKVKDGSEVYIAGGTVDVTYTVTPTTKALSEDITTKTLVNPLDNFEDTTILAAVKAENPELVEDEVEVVEGATDTTATIKVKDGSEVYTAGGTVDVTYTVTPTTKALSEDITTKTLVNPLDNFEDTTILAAVKAENPELVEDEVEVVEGATDIAATIKVKDGSEVYTAGDTVDVTYTVKTSEVELNTIIPDGTVLNDVATADETGVNVALAAQFKDLNLDEVTIAVDAEANTATITPNENSKVYTGDPVTVTFTLPEAPTMNYYSILNVHHLLADGPEYSYDDYTMTIMIGIEDLLNLDNNGYVYIPFTILPE